MAAYISFQPSDFFNTVLYTGNGTAIGSGGLAITGAGFQPDLTWIKNREQLDDHIWTDAVRGATKYITSDANDAQVTNAESLTTWGADGFTVGNHAAVNTSAETFVSWNWIANGAGSANEDGSTNTTATSANTTSKFSVGAYTGTGVAGMTIGHGLGIAPDFVLVKKTGGADRWGAYQSKNTAAPATEALYFNHDYATTDDASMWNDVQPSSTVVTYGDKGDTNAATTMVQYCWASVRGYSKFGKYVGNGNADGPFVYTGFRPAFVMAKRTDSTGYWRMIDNKRNSYNGQYNVLSANATTVQYTGSDDFGNTDLLSNGFKLRDDYDQVNASTGEYIYAAFAEFPFVSSNSKAGVAR